MISRVGQDSKPEVGHAREYFVFAEHQVGKVRAGDEEYEAGDTQEQQERCVIGLTQVTQTVRCRIGSQAKRAVGALGFRAVRMRLRSFKKTRADSVQWHGGLVRAPARLEAPHDCQPEQLAPRQNRGGWAKCSDGTERLSEVEIVSNLKTEKVGRRHAEDFGRMALYQKPAPDG